MHVAFVGRSNALISPRELEAEVEWLRTETYPHTGSTSRCRGPHTLGGIKPRILSCLVQLLGTPAFCSSRHITPLSDPLSPPLHRPVFRGASHVSHPPSFSYKDPPPHWVREPPTTQDELIPGSLITASWTLFPRKGGCTGPWIRTWAHLHGGHYLIFQDTLVAKDEKST